MMLCLNSALKILNSRNNQAVLSFIVNITFASLMRTIFFPLKLQVMGGYFNV